MHPLDNPAWASLTGPHAHFAERRGNALRYPAEVSPFVALPTAPEAADWEDMAALAGPGGLVPFAAVAATPPDGWEVVDSVDGVQLSGEDVTGTPDPEAVVLGPGDVPDMLALVARTKPGPFAPRTFEMGTYLGIRRDDVLVAMAGERLHPPGWTEVSAVCTDEAFRGQGLGSRLVLAVAAGIRSRGEIPFLHAASFNTTAIRLYQTLGFRLRRPAMFPAVRVPADVPVA
ncbi:GNAT family N-acetyltransferase [Sphaerisporangium sp. NPDC051011]|uniref:GNAT family N-acetyltransferase n=1 Tax=Sphaerisporangium sp. NPDC051011 TaxID=3155792 RepID=UPI0033E8133E